MSFQLGEIIGDYRVIGELGSGGMGTVYKVEHLISQRVEALKVLLPDLAGSPELADRFIREIRVQASLNHPNIASLHNAFRSSNQLLMVMEFIDGISLYMRMKQSPVPLWHGVGIINQTLAALSYAHACGVTHRDVKPANIMLTRQGAVKLMDFGIARSTSDKNLTQKGLAIGSAHYMSPEQVRGSTADARSDIYSIGVTLFELATGSRPFMGTSSFEIMSAHVMTAPPNPASLNQDLSPGLCAIILRALEKDPAQRFQSCDEFLESLQGMVRQPGTSNASSGAPTPQISLPEGILTTPMPGRNASPLTIPGPSQSAVKERPSTPPGGSSASAFSEDRIEELKKSLAQYVGPMAKLLVDRAMKKATNMKSLYEILSLEVPEGKDRERFLASRKKL